MKILLQHPTLIIGAGHSLAGKSSVMELVSARLGIRHLDINTNVRRQIFGEPPKDLRKETPNEAAEMLASYRIMCQMAEELLRLGRSVIVTATFSKAHYFSIFDQMMARNPDAVLRLVLIQPIPGADTAEAVDNLIEQRRAKGFDCAMTSHGRYAEIRDRFHANGMPVIRSRPHGEVFTWPTHTLEETAQAVIDYLARQ